MHIVGYNSVGHFSQTIYVAPSDIQTKFVNNVDCETLDETFIISGFAKAVGALKSDAGVFALRVDVTYYLRDGTYKTDEPIYFHFNRSSEEWQFVSGSFKLGNKVFELREGNQIREITGMVSSITVGGEFSFQPIGSAYFDNLSVICSTDDSVTNNLYYPNGYIATGNVIASLSRSSQCCD